MARVLGLEPLGSSPLSRGIQLSAEDAERLGGIIPALAGNTGYYYYSRRSHRDHPRSRGEYGVDVVDRIVLEGSSPLSRGILAWLLSANSLPRIIPALAGNTG